jgi:hypothetical protein
MGFIMLTSRDCHSTLGSLCAASMVKTLNMSIR